MEKSNSSAEGHPMKSDSPPSASESVVSLIQINSIAIDISCPMEEVEIPVQEHFSMRGFVAEVRKKNLKTHSPFSSLDTDGSVYNLPPLSAPKFRWWQCSHCIPENTTEKNGSDMAAENQNDIAGTSSQKTVAEDKCCFMLSITKGNGNNERGVVGISKGGHPYGNVPFWNRQLPNFSKECPSTRAEGPGDGSSGSSDGFVPLLARKKKKLRSLADIMEVEKKSAIGHLINRHASYNETHVTAMTAEADAKLEFLQKDREGLQNPHRKKWMAWENRRENLDSSCPMGEAKRLKVDVHPQKSDRRVEISDSETEIVPSERLCMPVASYVKRVKHKKNKIFHKSRKQRQVDADKRTVLPNVPELDAAGSDALRKHLRASNSSFDCTAPNASAIRGETVTFSKSKFADVSMHDGLWRATNAGMSGQRFNQEKVPLDLSLSSCSGAERKLLNGKLLKLRDIPDLNESIVEKTTVNQESLLPSAIQKSGSFHEKFMNVSFSGTEANAVEGKRNSDVSRSRSVQSRDNAAGVGGTVDDIPMEIVELLAKNQQERALENSRQKFSPKEMTGSSEGSRALCADGVQINTPFCSMENASSFANQNPVFGQSVLKFLHGKNFQSDASNPGTSQFRLFTPLVPIQQYNAGYLDPHPVLSGPRSIERADLQWHPLRNSMPFVVTVSQNCPVPPNSVPLHPLPEQFSKGKNVVIEKTGFLNASAMKEGRIPSSVGVLDGYSNVDIPAMQLLSLTNLRNAYGSPYPGGYSSFSDKPSSPLIQPPSLTPAENKNQLLIGSPFPLSRQLPHSLNGAPFSGESFNRAPLPAQMPAPSRDFQPVEKYNPKQPSSPNDGAPQVCVLNRNPADFTIPDTRNEYMITAKALKFKKRNASIQKPPQEALERKWVRRGSFHNQATAHNTCVQSDSQQQQHKIKNARTKNLPRKNGRQNM